MRLFVVLCIEFQGEFEAHQPFLHKVANRYSGANTRFSFLMVNLMDRRGLHQEHWGLLRWERQDKSTDVFQAHPKPLFEKNMLVRCKRLCPHFESERKHWSWEEVNSFWKRTNYRKQWLRLQLTTGTVLSFSRPDTRLTNTRLERKWRKIAGQKCSQKDTKL